MNRGHIDDGRLHVLHRAGAFVWLAHEAGAGGAVQNGTALHAVFFVRVA
jgi:hypothetical protein